MDCVYPGIYIGDQYDAEDRELLQKHGIDTVATLCP